VAQSPFDRCARPAHRAVLQRAAAYLVNCCDRALFYHRRVERGSACVVLERTCVFATHPVEISSTVAFSASGPGDGDSHDKALDGDCAIRQLCAHGETAPQVSARQETGKAATIHRRKVCSSPVIAGPVLCSSRANCVVGTFSYRCTHALQRIRIQGCVAEFETGRNRAPHIDLVSASGGATFFSYAF
jgi:hypothetical protein